MRLNIADKKGRGWTKADALAKPKFITSEILIGRVSSDLLSTVFGPIGNEIGIDVLEKYADDIVTYEDMMRDFKAEQEAEIDADGTVRTSAKEAPIRLPSLCFILSL